MLQPTEVAPQEIRPLKRHEYERLVALGTFDDDRVELIRGNLVTMAPNDPDHAYPIEMLTALLVRAVGERARVRVQLPIIAVDESEPEPDLAVVPGPRLAQEHPDHAHLIIEVAVSSLKKDRDVKGPLYATSGFEEYWIVNVPARAVEVFRNPSNGKYLDVAVYRIGETVRAQFLEAIAVPVAALFE